MLHLGHIAEMTLFSNIYLRQMNLCYEKIKKQNRFSEILEPERRLKKYERSPK